MDNRMYNPCAKFISELSMVLEKLAKFFRGILFGAPGICLCQGGYAIESVCGCVCRSAK